MKSLINPDRDTINALAERLKKGDSTRCKEQPRKGIHLRFLGDKPGGWRDG